MRLKERIIKFLNLKELINEINNEPITVYIEELVKILSFLYMPKLEIQAWI